MPFMEIAAIMTAVTRRISVCIDMIHTLSRDARAAVRQSIAYPGIKRYALNLQKNRGIFGG